MQFVTCAEGSAVLWNKDCTKSSLQFDLDQQFLAQGTDNTGDELEVNRPQVVYNDASWSKDNKKVVFATDTGKSLIFKSDGTFEKQLFEKETVEILSLSLSTKGRYLAAASSDGLVQLWDLKKFAVLRRFRGHDGPATSVQLNSSDSQFASCGVDGNVLVYSMQTGKLVYSLKPKSATKDPLHYVRYAPLKKTQLASAGDSGKVFIWDLTSSNLLATFSGHEAPCSGISYSATNDALLVSAGLDKRLVFYDINAKKIIRSVSIPSPASCVDLADDGVSVAIGTEQGTALLFDIRKPAHPIHATEAASTTIKAIRFQHDITGVGASPGHVERDPNPSATLSAASGTATTPTRRKTFARSLSEATGRGADSKSAVSAPAAAKQSHAPPANIPKPTVSLTAPGTPQSLSPTSSSNNLAVLPRPGSTLVPSLDTSLIFSPLKMPDRSALNQSLDYISPRSSEHTLHYSDSSNELDMASSLSMATAASFASRDSLGGLGGVLSPARDGSYQPTADFDMSIVALSPLGKHHPIISDSGPALVVTPASAAASTAGVSATPGRHVTLASPIRRLPTSVVFTPSAQAQRGGDSDETLSPRSEDGVDSSIMSFSSPLKRSLRPGGFDSAADHAGGGQMMDLAQVENMFQTFRQDVVQHVNNLHLDMLRQFQKQQNDFTELVEQLILPNKALLEEVARLKEENERLRKESPR